ncbi:hypothetical protein GLOIN_2v1826643 [Rhizophagus irregularis DAOM 181602=DAOM 197198]|uniref:Uncharacterized protein n=1 Tax=Rhizophagus irregularis (strain DAOM 181602 / DAOM 197198 / MUCL 43194) TaxID=747089 RepID=A0A2P4Q8H8_RHIID|nr:hypothetical protein GLOIN_2v1826643 [Rhizophagus irregularis DAOM 181602=DAOM 197198]POG73939.1 hypothetical protein GLOIN_2v1826643 [Rhizophagus irregularis DAOM 181602=DAOM 197198]|eukprot:XP_025180805.1 hypothetical protein GLOIN_2v1826643 [Rhizophagus irregularis DAOM 181602=DAOM 197198]
MYSTDIPQERKPKKVQKVAWSKEDETHRQALIKCAKAYAKAEQEVLSIPGTSAIGDIQYAVSLLNEQNKAEIWPDQFKPEYDLSLAESPVKEALVAARILGEFSDLTVKLIEELNYDFYWAVNETSKILSKVQEDSYDGDDLKDYDLRECDNSMEVNDMSSPVPSQHE